MERTQWLTSWPCKTIRSDCPNLHKLWVGMATVIPPLEGRDRTPSTVPTGLTIQWALGLILETLPQKEECREWSRKTPYTNPILYTCACIYKHTYTHVHHILTNTHLLKAHTHTHERKKKQQIKSMNLPGKFWWYRLKMTTFWSERQWSQHTVPCCKAYVAWAGIEYKSNISPLVTWN